MTRAHNESVTLQSRCSYSQVRAIRLNSHDDRSADNNVKTLSKLLSCCVRARGICGDCEGNTNNDNKLISKDAIGAGNGELR